VHRLNFPFPLAVQLVLPPDYAQNPDLRADLSLLQGLGFHGVEVNIARPEETDLRTVGQYLQDAGLAFTMFASGLTAKTAGLSLSSDDAGVRRRSVATCKQMIDRLAGSATGMIVGFLKGGPGVDRQGAQGRFAEALAQIAPYAAERQVRVLIEATNRYESAVANALSTTADLVHSLDTPYLGFLPDTFHMNIEEPESISAALKRWAGRFDALHLSDNNRRFPGFGAIDFAAIFATLEEIGYGGTVAIEGNIQKSFREEIKAAAEYLARAADQAKEGPCA
jgi:sugar phosphate isomerase/epimerase